jgi:hypothetical protein
MFELRLWRLQHKSVLSGRYVKSIPLIHLNTASYHTAEVQFIAGRRFRQSYRVIGSGCSGGPVHITVGTNIHLPNVSLLQSLPNLYRVIYKM